MSSLTVNDILDELLDENRRILNRLLFAHKIFVKSIEFKELIDSIDEQFVDYLKPDQKKKYKELSHELNNLMDQKLANISDELPNESKTVTVTKSETSDDRIEGNDNYHTINEDNVIDEEEYICKEYYWSDIEEDEEEEGIAGELVLENTVTLNNPNDYEGSDDGEPLTEEPMTDKLSVRTVNISHKPMTRSSAKAVSGQQLPQSSGEFNVSSKPSAKQKSKPNSRGKKKAFPFKSGSIGANYGFRKRKAMTAHRKKLHQWKCDFPGCDYQTEHTYRVKKHLKRHSNDRPFKCNHCYKKYKQKKDLTEHMQRQHLDQCPNDPLLVCDWNECQYRTKSLRALNEHKCSHTLPFECQICKHRFSVKNNMKKHLISKHNVK